MVGAGYWATVALSERPDASIEEATAQSSDYSSCGKQETPPFSAGEESATVLLALTA